MKLAYIILGCIIIALYFMQYEYKKLPKRDPDVVFLFCSGGYDSVFRLCDLTITEKKDVQPIYLGVGIDGELHRQNVAFELKSINNAIQKINKINKPEIGYVYPVHIVRHLTLSNSVKKSSAFLHKMGAFSRDINQYSYMAEYSLALDRPIETGVMCTDNGTMDKAVGKNINPVTKRLSFVYHPSQLMFQNMVFPLYKMTKSQMRNIAKHSGFIHILQQTVSCWFPDANGAPCRQCVMCKERII